MRCQKIKTFYIKKYFCNICASVCPKAGRAILKPSDGLSIETRPHLWVEGIKPNRGDFRGQIGHVLNRG